MRTDRHRTRHKVRLKDTVLQADLDGISRRVARADSPRSPGATSPRPKLAAIVWHLRIVAAWRALPTRSPPSRTV